MENQQHENDPDEDPEPKIITWSDITHIDFELFMAHRSPHTSLHQIATTWSVSIEALTNLNSGEDVMRKFALVTLASLIAVAAVPAHATLADRKSDQPSTETAQPAPYSGQVVIRGEVRSENAKKDAAEPAPYSGQIVIRGEVKSESHG